MLSYRHSYHAGNFADVLKHIVLTEIIQYLLKKNKPFEYIDTHAGAGVYNLESFEASKLSEYKKGVARLSSNDYPQLDGYFSVLKSLNQPLNELSFYPGSPYFAVSMMRTGDRAHLHELHGKDFTTLNQLMSDNIQFKPEVKVKNGDGYEGLIRLLPPVSRRALILIDPSYEVKSEYQLMIDTVIKAHKKFATGIYAIWYPVVDRIRINQIDHILIKSGIRDIQRFELGLSEDSDELGMTGSGMWVINPPWGLFEKMRSVLPQIQNDLDSSDEKGSQAYCKYEVMVNE